MEELLKKELEELKEQKQKALSVIAQTRIQLEKWTGELNACNGAIQTLEKLLKPKEEQKNAETTKST